MIGLCIIFWQCLLLGSRRWHCQPWASSWSHLQLIGNHGPIYRCSLTASGHQIVCESCRGLGGQSGTCSPAPSSCVKNFQSKRLDTLGQWWVPSLTVLAFPRCFLPWRPEAWGSGFSVRWRSPLECFSLSFPHLPCERLWLLLNHFWLDSVGSQTSM